MAAKGPGVGWKSRVCRKDLAPAGHYWPGRDAGHPLRLSGTAHKSEMWEVMLVAAAVLTEQSACQSLDVVSSPCWVHLPVPEQAQNHLENLDSQWAAPWGWWTGGCSPEAFIPAAHGGSLDDAHEMLEILRAGN